MKQLAQGVAYLALFGALWFGFSWWTSFKVLADAEDEYQIAQRSGDRPRACAKALVAAEAALKHKDETAYNQWRLTASKTCD